LSAKIVIRITKLNQVLFLTCPICGAELYENGNILTIESKVKQLEYTQNKELVKENPRLTNESMNVRCPKCIFEVEYNIDYQSIIKDMGTVERSQNNNIKRLN
jgi:hypothetical protein